MGDAGGKTLEDLQAEHRLGPRGRHRIPSGEAAEDSAIRNYIRDLVLGFNDGLVSVYAIVAGVTGAAFASHQILVAGLSAGVAGALSMGIGEYLSTKSQAEYYAAEAEREREHIARWPELERQEVREMLAEKGIPEDVIPRTVEAIASDEDRFVDFMMREEFGVGSESERSPWKAMAIVMAAFVVGAVLPVVPFTFLSPLGGLELASALAVAGLFGAGAAKGYISGLHWLRPGLEMLILGVVAAAITYGVGTLVGVGA